MPPRRSARNKKAVENKAEDVEIEEPPKKKSRATKKPKPAEAEQEENVEADSEDWKTAASIYDFTAKDINGEPVSLDKYKGHVCVIVNVASRCGHTKSNYEQFVEIYDKYADDKGLRILAFPCNQFGGQEPGDSQKICEFVKKRDVKFDIFDKINVNGKNAHPLWKFLKDKVAGPKGSDIEWNFTKFIVDKEGQVVDRYKSSVKPLQLVEHLEKLW